MSTSAEYIPGVAELGRKNQAGGYVGIDDSGDVQGTFAQRVDTAANIAGIVLANGELAFTTDTKETFLGDGITAGGVFVHQVLRHASISPALTDASMKFSGGTPASVSLDLPAGLYRVQYGIHALLEFSEGLQFRLTAVDPSSLSLNIRESQGDPSGLVEKPVAIAGLTTTIRNGPASTEPIVVGEGLMYVSAGTMKLEAGFVTPATGDLLGLELFCQKVGSAL